VVVAFFKRTQTKASNQTLMDRSFCLNQVIACFREGLVFYLSVYSGKNSLNHKSHLFVN
jgi:hypothetical protein